MRPGNKNLFLGQNKSWVSFHLSPTTTMSMGVCTAKLTSMKCTKIKTCDFSYEDLQSAFQMVHNLHKRRNDCQCEKKKKTRWQNDGETSTTLSERSSSEVVPDIRNGMKIFSPVSGWMMACVQRAWHHPHAAPEEARVHGGAANLWHLWQVKHLPAWSSGRPTAAQVSGAVGEKNSNQSRSFTSFCFYPIMQQTSFHLYHIDVDKDSPDCQRLQVEACHV